MSAAISFVLSVTNVAVASEVVLRVLNFAMNHVALVSSQLLTFVARNSQPQRSQKIVPKISSQLYHLAFTLITANPSSQYKSSRFMRNLM